MGFLHFSHHFFLGIIINKNYMYGGPLVYSDDDNDDLDLTIKLFPS